ncbi:hypothetical protein ALT721_1220005 [Alteromonas alvinellae]
MGDMRVTITEKYTQTLVYEVAINDIIYRYFRIILTLSIAYVA